MLSSAWDVNNKKGEEKMLSNKPSSGFQTVLGFNSVAISLILLMCVTAFGAIDTRLGILDSFTRFLGFDNTTGSVSGIVTYGNAASPPVLIANATVCANGGSQLCTTTDENGYYYLAGFASGAYSVCVSKSREENVATAYDAAMVEQHVSGANPFTAANQMVSADASGNNALSSTDSGYIANDAVGSTPSGMSGDWRFFISNYPTFPVGSSPTCHTFESVTTENLNKNFTGILVGDVAGAYTGILVGDRGNHATQNNDLAVELPGLTAQANKEVTIPIRVQGAAKKGIIAYQFDLRYDPAVIQPQANAVSLARTLSRELSFAVNAKESGLIRIAVYGSKPIAADGVLLNLKFAPNGAQGSASPLTLERIKFNDGEPLANTASGRVELF